MNIDASPESGVTSEDVSSNLNFDAPVNNKQSVIPEVDKFPTWMEQLGKDLKTNKELTKFSKLDDFGKAYLSLQESNKGKIYVPDEKSTKEEVAAFRKAMNIPEKETEYLLERPKFPEGMSVDEILETKFRQIGLKNNLTQSQMKAIFDMFNEYSVETNTAVNKFIEDNRNATIDKLKKLPSWQGDKYEENRNKASIAFNTAIKKLNPPAEIGGIEGVLSTFKNYGAGDNPVFVWFFSQLFNSINPDSIGNTGNNLNAPTNKISGMLDFNM